MPSMAKKALLIMAAGMLLAGCGVRGPLEMPKADPNAAVPSSGATATAQSGQGKPANTADRPHQSFFLDGLLR